MNELSGKNGGAAGSFDPSGGVVRSLPGETGAEGSRLCSLDDAEDLLLGAMEYLAAMPDRERGWLKAGGRTGWPSFVRDVFDAYDSGEAPVVRVQVGRKHVELVERMLTGPDAAVMAVPVEYRAMLGRVLAGKLWGVPGKGGPAPFTWEAMWERERWLARRRGDKLAVAVRGLRGRYDRALGKVAVAVGTV